MTTEDEDVVALVLSLQSSLSWASSQDRSRLFIPHGSSGCTPGRRTVTLTAVSSGFEAQVFTCRQMSVLLANQQRQCIVSHGLLKLQFIR